MEHRLLEWIDQQDLNKRDIKRMVVKKARELSTCASFKASKGWLAKFIKRNKL